MAQLTIPPVPAKTYNVQSFNSTSTFTVPTSSTGFIDIIMCAGGAGGGRSSSTGYSGGGGAGGQVVFLQNVAVPLGQTITVTVGAGGVGATSAGNDGSDGSDTTVTNLGALTFATSFTASGGYRGQTNNSNTGYYNVTVYSQYANNTHYWGNNSDMSISMTGMNVWSCAFNSNQSGNNNSQSTPNWWQSAAPLVGPSTVQLWANSNPGFYSFLPKAYQTKQGTAGVAAVGAAGPSSASTTLFAGRGATGGQGTGGGGTGQYGAGGGGGGSNSGGTQAGAGGNGGANSGAGGGGGGANSSTASNSGNGGTGGSGFVVIGYWG